MALKPDRNLVHGADISYFMNTVAADRGIIVTHYTTTSGVGAAMDDGNAVVIIPTGAVGSPVGLLMTKVVNYDLTRQRINPHQDEVQLGSKVTIMKQGVAVTDQIYTGDTPAPGAAAHFTTDGQLTTTTTSTQVGKFLSAKDSDGYAKVEINIP